MSGKGAAPFVSSWLGEGTGETPGQAMANLLLPGRLDEATDAELQAAWVENHAQWAAETAAIHDSARADIAALEPTLAAAEAGDSAIVAARAAERAASVAEDQAERAIRQRMAAMRDTLLALPVAQRRAAIDADAQIISLRADHAAADADLIQAFLALQQTIASNPTVAALTTQRQGLRDALGRLAPDMQAVKEEARRRGITVG